MKKGSPIPLSFIGWSRLTLAKATRAMPSFRGKVRTMRALDRSLRKLDCSPVEAKIEGVNYLFDTEDLIDFNLLFLGGYQSGLVTYIIDRLQRRRVPVSFWDIGANVGSVSLPIACLLSEVEVQAFEPSPPVFRRLEANLRRNPDLLPRISAKPYALSDRNGLVEFYVSNESFNSGVGGLGCSHNRAKDATWVTTRRADDLVDAKEVRPPDLIKIDVEGFEIEVFLGMERVLKSRNDIEIVFEHSLYRMHERGLPKTHVVDFLREIGFSIRVLDADEKGTRQLGSGDLDRDCDLVAIKGSS
jgi:FkbM family methyltransferase